MPNDCVYIVDDSCFSYAKMYVERGWDVTEDFDKASLVQFTGGEDVSPHFYGQHTHEHTYSSPVRDKKEKIIYASAVKKEKDIVGICRGGQFLNVMCGGSLWQDVNGHFGSHPATDKDTGEEIFVTSTHHQMMIPSSESDHLILLTANQTTHRIEMSHLGSESKYEITHSGGKGTDSEAIFYYDNKVLCFQPHPEFINEEKLRDLFFGYIGKYLRK